MTSRRTPKFIGSPLIFYVGTGTWYRIDARCGSGADSIYEVRINGTQEFAGSGSINTGNHGFAWAGKSPSRNGNSVDFYYDDILRSHSGFVTAGEIYIVDLPPNADGSKQTGWTGTPTNSYQDVDDEVRSNAEGSDWWESDDAGDERSVGFQSMSDLGISEVDEILVVTANALLRNPDLSGGSIASIQVRLYSGTAYVRKALHNPPNLFYNGRYIGTPLDPATKDVWTLNAIASLEFGVYNDANVAVRCNFIACTVVFKPAS